MSANQSAPADRWPAFRDAFYTLPNNLDLSRRVPALDRLLAVVADLLSKQPPRPILLPAVIGVTSYYYGIAFSPEQARTLRELLQSHIGDTWSDFDGRPVRDSALTDPLVQAAVQFAGDQRFVYRLRVPADERDRVRATVMSLLTSLRTNSRRTVRLAVPIGRMIGDLEDACAVGAAGAAERAYAALANDHRISETNRLFLHVQVLAAFGRWQELADHPMLGNLLRLDRPSPVSDALAQLALANLAPSPTLQAFQPIGTRFGSLIDSTSAIRTPSGAMYYTLWALTAGESADDLKRRLTDAGWATPAVTQLLAATTPAPEALAAPTDAAQMRTHAITAIAQGRYDTAVELLASLPPDPRDLPAVIEAVTKTFTPGALALLEAHRSAHGEEALRQASMNRPPLPSHTAMALTDRLRTVFDPATPQARLEELVEGIKQVGLSELRAPGGVDSACQVLCDLTVNGDLGHVGTGVDTCLDLVRDLRTSAADPSQVRSLSMATLELWGFHDTSGDRHRARRIGLLAGDAVEAGCSVAQFDEITEILRAGWDPFLTDVDLPTSIDILEQLVAYQPTGAAGLDKFAIPVLSRVGPHNAARLPSAALAVAVDLAPTFGLTIDIPPADTTVPAGVSTISGLTIALYSLEQTALARAKKLLQQRHPGLTFQSLSDHVATDALKTAAKAADLFVIADRAAKHAATDAIKTERRDRPTEYAAGKGSTSLIESVEAWLHNYMAAADGDT
ncbi:protein DpdD [Dactylosporangium sp. CA-052675]|uniref:protein DpdD n=1 Tax=Dactylosporangium sp. CA-052675 TaxID=3239927 RepID=UPI003D91762A